MLGQKARGAPGEQTGQGRTPRRRRPPGRERGAPRCV